MNRKHHAERAERFHCSDCKIPTWDEYYCIDNRLWSTHAWNARQLCILCLEKRVGRRLTRRDFSLQTPINLYPLVRTAVLRSRLELPQGWIDVRVGLYPLDWAANNWVLKAYSERELTWRSAPAVPASEVAEFFKSLADTSDYDRVSPWTGEPRVFK